MELALTGKPRADAALEEIVREFEAAFPGRARYVLLGSYANGTASESSDLDVLVVFRERLTDHGRDHAESLTATIVSSASIDVDVGVCSVEDCPPVWAVCLRAGETIFGAKDIVVPLPALEAYVAAIVPDVRALMQGLRPGQQTAVPLAPPNPALPLLGYEAKPLRNADGSWRPSSKALSMITCWGATALIAVRHGDMVASKDDVIGTYRELIGDEWTSLLEDVERTCRHRGYVIPAGADGVAEIRAIAERVLEWENHLAKELRSEA